jgi:alkanesulfonate monooxygenase SsuD/methylene tetrahydromethanopterin reductase-like flavin-dependent oxidoreductase (luciferase family)
MFFYLTDDRRAAQEMFTEVSSTLNRPVGQLREQLLIGSPGACVEKLGALMAAGVQKVFLWPAADEVAQLARFQQEVVARIPK